MAWVISSDTIKGTLPGYNPRLAGDLHDRSTELADQAYETALHNRPERTVILMSGGSASGKSEYVSVYLRRRRAIISDGTSSTFSRAKRKIEKALDAGKKVEVHAIWPNELLTAFIAFLNRERQFPVEHFYRTHSHSRKTLLEIARNFPNIPITLISSDYRPTREKQGMLFRQLIDRDREQLIEYITDNQYTEEEIKQATIYEV